MAFEEESKMAYLDVDVQKVATNVEKVVEV